VVLGLYQLSLPLRHASTLLTYVRLVAFAGKGFIGFCAATYPTVMSTMFLHIDAEVRMPRG